MGARAVEDPFDLTGATLGGRYRIDRAVAAGGFGVVYRACHATLGAAVAVKVLRLPDAMNAEQRAGFARMFMAEAKIVASLEHPAVVRMLDYGVEAVGGEPLHWMAMEWVDGVTLAEDLERRRGAGGRSPRECLDLLAPVLEALTVAHRRGIVHRDLKPRNLMLPALPPELEGARRSAVARLKVLDFGVAKVMTELDAPVTGATQTKVELSGLTIQYAAQEQLQKLRTGPWTDVHAIGLILTELLTGERAYQGRDVGGLVAQAMSPLRPTPARFGLDVGAWEPVIARALALHPGDRFLEAGQLLAALEAEVPDAAVSTPVVATAPMGEPALAEVTAPTLRPATVLAHSPQTTPKRRAAVIVAAFATVGVAAVTWQIASRRTPGAVRAASVPALVEPPRPAASAALSAAVDRPSPTLAPRESTTVQTLPPASAAPEVAAARRAPRSPTPHPARRRRRVTPE